ncbi:MAG: sugar-binding domain-containing protein [Candidatus Omnitrophota bacterium]
MKNFRNSIVKTAILLCIMGISGGALAETPRPAHPRPDLRRDAFINLNGEWNFAFDEKNAGEAEGWFKPDKSDWPKKIVVPYPWESKLSGIGDMVYKGAAWYQRRFTLPAEWSGKQVLLHFGAVDWSAKVWLDGNLLGEHDGGYTPFTFLLSGAADGKEHVLTVKAVDDTSSEQPVGKQIGWYTRTSGIWQTVYLEAGEKAGQPYIQDIRIEAKTSGEVFVSATPSQKVEKKMTLVLLPDVYADDAGPSAAIDSSDGFDGLSGTIKIEKPKLWSPSSPMLYFMRLNLFVESELVDSVHTYFGLRDVSRGKYGENPYEYIYLNGQPFYILSALDQAFHPDGIYTYPTDDAVRKDLADAKEFGFNNLRLHIKADEPRFYYWADRLGVTILYDMPCFIDYTEKAQRNYVKTMTEAIQRDFNHPSIIAWVLFNETWGLKQQKTPEGQAWVKEIFEMTKKIDSTRLIEDNSPCNYDHVLTDINSWHFYIYPHKEAREHIEKVVKETYPGSEFNYIGGHKQGIEPLMNSEYGGVSAGMGDRDISWCFHYLTQELRRHQKICGYIYTELQDIEWEHNGFMNYDRSRKVFGYEDFVPAPKNHPRFTYRDLNTADFLVLDAMAGENLSGKDKKSVPVSLSLYSGRECGRFNVYWQVYAMERMSSQWKTIAKSSQPASIEAKAYSVMQAKPIEFAVPKTPSLILLYAWVEDGKGELAARNFWTFHNLDAKAEAAKGTVCWNPADYKKAEGEVMDFPKGKRDAVSLPGKAAITYEIELPKDLDLSKIKKAQFICEMGACAGIQRVDWKEKIRTVCTPQTDVNNVYPSTVEVLVNGQSIGKAVLPNDPADYRGILSNILEMAPPSSYGFLQTMEVPVKLIDKDKPVSITIQTADGIRIFGEKSGRYPIPPTLIFSEE